MPLVKLKLYDTFGAVWLGEGKTDVKPRPVILNTEAIRYIDQPDRETGPAISQIVLKATSFYSTMTVDEIFDEIHAQTAAADLNELG